MSGVKAFHVFFEDGTRRTAYAHDYDEAILLVLQRRTYREKFFGWWGRVVAVETAFDDPPYYPPLNGDSHYGKNNPQA